MNSRNAFRLVVVLACVFVNGAAAQSIGIDEQRLHKALEIVHIKFEYALRSLTLMGAAWLPDADKLAATVIGGFDRRGWPSPEARQKMLGIVREDIGKILQTTLEMVQDQAEPILANQYALRFDDKELDALLLFYRTNTGHLYAELKETITESMRERQPSMGKLTDKHSVEPQALARRRAVIRAIVPLDLSPPGTQIPPAIVEMHEKSELAFADVIGDVLDAAAQRLTVRDYDGMLQFHTSAVGRKETRLSGEIFASFNNALKSNFEIPMKPLLEKWRIAYLQIVSADK